MKLPTKLLPDLAYVHGKPRLWLVPLVRRDFSAFADADFVSYRSMWSLEHDISSLENKQQIKSILDITPAYALADEQEKIKNAQLFYDWIHNVQPYDFVVGFLGVGHLAIGQVLGPCVANLDVDFPMFKYARAAHWSELRLPVGILSASEQSLMARNREKLLRFNNLVASRILLLALMQAAHWNDSVLLGIAQIFSSDFLQSFNAKRYAEYQQLLYELNAESAEFTESAENNEL